MATTFKKAMKKFEKYCDRVITHIKDTCPDAEFTFRIMAECFGNNIPPTLAADIIIKIHRCNQAEKELQRA